MERIKFTVDAALLRELGERLVGQPHIALAELVKNSYDADATEVSIEFSQHHLVVRDNGHGMVFEEFKNFWMRIGSPHKRKQRSSRNLGRPLTGSKGVGRLAVQFLGRELEMYTVSDRKTDQEILAIVDWDTAVEAEELTEAEALYDIHDSSSSFPGDSKHGTVIKVSRLNREWAPEDFKRLAQEIWWLQPPLLKKGGRSEAQASFKVSFSSEDQEAVEQFDTQMRAILSIWHARLTGSLVSTDELSETKQVKVSLEFSDGTHTRHVFTVEDCPLDYLEFEVRTFYLKHRQPYGIKVGEAREYFNEHGGLYVYDSGFRLPYYGPEHDWLDLEFAHAHRLDRSQLLPDELQVPSGLSYLPTRSRLLGVAHVNTTHEREVANSKREEYQALYDACGDSQGKCDRYKRLRNRYRTEYLDIQVTRDRLTDNLAYEKLGEILRLALDFYAMEEARRRLQVVEKKRPTEPAARKFRRVDQVLEHYKSSIPRPAFSKLKEEVEEAIEASETEAEVIASKVEVLAPLATAGMLAIAHEHESKKQIAKLDQIAEELEHLPTGDPDLLKRRLVDIAQEIKQWSKRANELRALFSPLMDEENREARGRFKAASVLRDVREQLQSLTRHASIELEDVDPELRLPLAGFTQWSALFQNVFLNAVNATLDADERKIAVRSQADGKTREILIEDTGSGVPTEDADKLFEPFVRRTQLTPERRQLGLGGSGLGLTIVRMLASEIGCQVSFVEPSTEFNTAFRLAWEENS